MTVIVANNVPNAIRGIMKRWFIELRPNVFVGTLNPRTHSKVINYILRNAPDDFGMMIISSAPNSQGYMIERHGPCGLSGREETEVAGIPLILEKSGTPRVEQETSQWPF
jgi:CRISPR-associated endoribonuclease Cas2 subtype I-E